MITFQKMNQILSASRLAIVGKMRQRGCTEDQIIAVQHADAVEFVEDMQHALFICDTIEYELQPKARREKMMRWLGWLQKTLQIHRVLSLPEQKMLNAPDDPASAMVEKMEACLQECLNQLARGVIK